MAEQHRAPPPSEDDDPEFSVFSAFLKRRGLKLTDQRRHILARALAEPKHFSAEQLLTDLARSGEDRSISKATVYRTLALLVEAHLLDSLDFERGYKLYGLCASCKKKGVTSDGHPAHSRQRSR